ncbi:uncharacterized protein BX663DRAFT_492903 [Cokeromyces recurvatus]|uniref:uncharacterized protein n=1 Tax=Cokeromyces recurvatus TaxID=90255 RepID=UPI00221EB8F1|nr:uncharacterized protein BX663DRAFT_492903 [Cokeromyces recurvatus]KAI7908075.1 hypothetical protein BX663DRAFT_492903 [Cokeromyces recurvatus]
MHPFLFIYLFIYHCMLCLLIIVFLSLFIMTGSLFPLHKHLYQVQSPVNESEILTSFTSSNNNNSDTICGEASLSCIAFVSYDSSIPVRCGVLTEAPLCIRFDSKTQKLKCDTFCDTDGSGRICMKAFKSCCSNSLHGCVSSKPRNIKLYKNSPWK